MMNKREKEEMANLREQLTLAKALAWPGYAEPLPMKYSGGTGLSSLEVGWSLSYHTDYVRAGCFTKHTHSYGNTNGTSSQGPGVFYSTKEEALMALRHSVTKACAKRLANIDALMLAEREAPSSPDGEEGPGTRDDVPDTRHTPGER